MFDYLWARTKANCRHDIKWLRHQWLIAATVASILVAIFVWVSLPSDEAEKFATYLSGFASALAFLWLAAGFRLQTEELSLQRQELQLQRIAAQQQAKELSNSAKLSSLSQIHTLLRDAESEVKDSPLGIKLTELPSVYMSGMEYWKPIEDSKNPQVVIDAYNQWLPREAVSRNYIRHIASAMKLYIEHHHPDHAIENSKSEEEFVFVYQSWVTKAPFLSHHIGVAAMLAQFMFMMKPGTDRILLAVTIAHAKLLGTEMFNADGLVEMRDKVLAKSKTLPAICTPWPE